MYSLIVVLKSVSPDFLSLGEKSLSKVIWYKQVLSLLISVLQTHLKKKGRFERTCTGSFRICRNRLRFWWRIGTNLDCCWLVCCLQSYRCAVLSSVLMRRSIRREFFTYHGVASYFNDIGNLARDGRQLVFRSLPVTLRDEPGLAGSTLNNYYSVLAYYGVLIRKDYGEDFPQKIFMINFTTSKQHGDPSSCLLRRGRSRDLSVPR